MDNISVEFFPPRNLDTKQKLFAEVDKICKKLKCDFFSVTFGAGGSAQDQTLSNVIDIQKHTGIITASHLSCINTSADDIRAILTRLQKNNINHLVVVRGDSPSGAGFPHQGDFIHASNLVEFIRQETDEYFNISVAAYPEYHPEAASADKDIQNFVKKVKMGANKAITQYFYNFAAYEHFIEQTTKLNVNIPIIPGIMPITNAKGLIRFSEACKADIPRWIKLKLEQYKDDKASLCAFGEDVVTRLCDDLLNFKVPGLHFYSLNKAKPTLNIIANLTNDIK